MLKKPLDLANSLFDSGLIRKCERILTALRRENTVSCSETRAGQSLAPLPETLFVKSTRYLCRPHNQTGEMNQGRNLLPVPSPQRLGHEIKLLPMPPAHCPGSRCPSRAFRMHWRTCLSETRPLFRPHPRPSVRSYPPVCSRMPSRLPLPPHSSRRCLLPR